MRKWSAHLQYSWWKYLLLILATVFIWCGVFSSLAKPAANTRIRVLYVGDSLDTQSLQQQLQQVLLPQMPESVNSITVEAVVFPEDMFEQLLLARTYDYDLVLISQQYMRPNIGQGIFLRLPEDQLPDYTYYRETELKKAYGVILPFEEEVCYGFISPHSVNIYPLNDLSKEGDCGALEVLEYLHNRK